jgi:hypothetical protein
MTADNKSDKVSEKVTLNLNLIKKKDKSRNTTAHTTEQLRTDNSAYKSASRLSVFTRSLSDFKPYGQ